MFYIRMNCKYLEKKMNVYIVDDVVVRGSTKAQNRIIYIHTHTHTCVRVRIEAVKMRLWQKVYPGDLGQIIYFEFLELKKG